MTRSLRGLTALFALAALCAAVPAKAEILNPDNVILKAGVSMPSDGLARDANRNWFAGGLEYQIGDPEARRVNSVELLYTGVEDDVSVLSQDDLSVKYAMLSLMFNHRVRSMKGAGLDNVLFYGAGAGLQNIWAEIKDQSPGSTANFDDKRTFLGANVFIGYEVAANFEIQAKYQFVFGKVAGEPLDALQLLAGFRF